MSLHFRSTSTPRTLRKTPFLFVMVALIGLLAGCTSLGLAGGKSTNDDPPSTTPVSAPPGNGVAEDLRSSIVAVFAAGNHDEVLGSAVVIDEDGLILTSRAIVENDIEVMLPDGSVTRPALVSIEPAAELALLKVEAEGLTPVEFSADRLSAGAEVFVTGYDGTPPTLGQMSGTVTTTTEDASDLPYRVRGSAFLETDAALLSGFIGGALFDDAGQFIGTLNPAESSDGEQVFGATSHWLISAWLENREQRLDDLAMDAESWEVVELPAGWAIPRPDGWNLNVSADSDDTFRAELTPSDPDVPLQFAISVEPNQYGTDAGAFVESMFQDRASARVWSVTARHDLPFVRIAMTQEGALVDVAYYLDESHLIAISLTSSYHPAEDPAQVDEARVLFETVVDGLHRP